MLKRTLYFGNPAYLSLKNNQLQIKNREGEIKTASIEDLGYVVLDHQQITISHAALNALIENNCAVITCDQRHLPSALFLPLAGNSLQNERFRAQVDASLPLKKQLWQQTIKQKITNQAKVLEETRDISVKNMRAWANSVRSGDPDNREAVAANYYWKKLFPDIDFVRDRYGAPPNNLLNYGYAILRAVVARALVSSGLLPTLGIKHHNQYNAYCLADDIMEPYRPFVDRLVIEILENEKDYPFELSVDLKAKLLSIPVLDVKINDEQSVLMNAVSKTTASLYRCFSGLSRRLIYPEV